MRGIAPLVVEDDRVVVGYADVQVNGYIDHFFVAAAFNRQGVGSMLMQGLHDVAAQRGLESPFADVSVTARPSFQRWGFSVEGRRKLHRSSKV